MSREMFGSYATDVDEDFLVHCEGLEVGADGRLEKAAEGLKIRLQKATGGRPSFKELMDCLTRYVDEGVVKVSRGRLVCPHLNSTRNKVQAKKKRRQPSADKPSCDRRTSRRYR